ncbi:alkaline phosphatase [Glaciecola sp. KUL10]|uniref:alkaline phosphatase n=1 Tax=Glaciecola sp. (strain KUL10) TaxID=2161813 RepID=UPI001F289988|nr:alkaline phosphatase [Glaciecola sp. KUL10]
MNSLKMFLRHKIALGVIACGFTLSACSSSNVVVSNTQAEANKPQNIIMVVADGMGPAYTTAYRYFKDDPNTSIIEETALDSILTGTARTYPASVSGLVTDSAASATSLAAGVKTYNGAIGLDVNKKPVETVLHRAKTQGMKTGVAVTSQIVHATPAAYIAHNESRRNYNQIADSFLDDRLNGMPKADVMLGGGWDYFLREDRNLVEEFKSLGYQYADSYEALDSLETGKATLGLFANMGLPRALDDSSQTRLSTLTKHALKHLENPNGFFLLVEASQVDWAGHGNDIASAMYEMADLEASILLLKEYVKENPDTLVVLTADHSTGGLTIGAKGEYRWSPEFLHNMTASTSYIASKLFEQDDRVAFVESKFGFELNTDEQNRIAAIEQGMKSRAVEAVLKTIIDERTNTGWTTSGHTGVDVEVFAFGKGADNFLGNMDNIDIASKIFDLLEK